MNLSGWLRFLQIFNAISPTPSNYLLEIKQECLNRGQPLSFLRKLNRKKVLKKPSAANEDYQKGFSLP